ncbi:hypothetical protein [Psychroserpens luteus]|uniref:Uncharacterized protein n=1 Tax=Psychroserpens luteus TaxID=1434066 RepID=A0ABW5ZZR3_9FLAO|nr:hypothetical protein [Psychroserpens luteus]
MGITLESIYKPVNDFFLNTFKSDEGAPVEFRLQQFGTVISEEDFEGLSNEEMSSDLVNEIPYVEDNGLNVGFLSNNIDSVYELILGAQPFVDESLSHDEKEVIHNNVMRTLAQVGRDLESFSLVRGNGITDFFRLTNLSPSNWFESDSKVWEKREFEIKEPKSIVESEKSNTNQKILKVRMTDAQLINVLPMLEDSKKVKPLELKMQVLKMQPAFIANPIMINKVHTSKPIRRIRDHRKVQKPVLARRVNMTLKPTHKKISNVKRTAVGLKFSQAFHGLRLNEKILVKDFIKKESPSKAIKTNDINISFEFCVVNIRRKWFNEVICNINRSWYIPGIPKGALSNPKIGGLSHLPVAFLAVKNLNITANWDNLDKKELENVVSFGPFDINNQNIKEKGSLSHDGIQIIGWMLQKLPELPPHGKN